MRSIRLAILGTMISLLSACQWAGISPSRPSVHAVSDIHLRSSGHHLVAPDGYCIDTQSVKTHAKADFAAMASCAALRGEVHETNAQTYLLTLSLSAPVPKDALNLHDLEGALTSQAGRSLLARSGSHADLDVLWSDVEDGIAVAHLRDVSESRSQDLSDEHWRAITLIDGRILSLTGMQFQRAQASDSDMKAMIMQLAQNFRTINAAFGDENSISSNKSETMTGFLSRLLR